MFVLCPVLTCYSVCFVVPRRVTMCCVVPWHVLMFVLCLAVTLTMFVLCRALACSEVCVVSCSDLLQCLCCVVPWRVLKFVLFRVVSCPEVF